MDNSEYQAGIKLLNNKNAQHPILDTLKKGFSLINVEYLIFALENVELYQNEVAKLAIESTNSTLRALYRNLGRLMNQRSISSNKFHVCTSNAQRATVVDEISRLQKKIKKLYLDIESFELNGKIPEVKSVEKYPIPETPILMQKKISNLNSQISRQKRDVKSMTLAFRKSQDVRSKKRIFKFERKLEELKIHLGYVKNALAVATL